MAAEPVYPEAPAAGAEARGAPGSRRCALVIAYRGTAYGGWQRQPNAPSVQATLEAALATVVGRSIATVGSGRTDAGVHASGQVVHLDAPVEVPPRALVLGSNRYLPSDVRVLWAGVVGSAFDARKEPVRKEYRYRLSRAAVISPFESEWVVPLERRVDLDRLRLAMPSLLGRHDFAAFAKSGGAHRQSWRTLLELDVAERGAIVELRFVGDGFLRGMVRALVGTLLEVGAGRRSDSDLRALVAGAARSAAGPNAPARGLILSRVWYEARHLARETFPPGEHERLVHPEAPGPPGPLAAREGA